MDELEARLADYYDREGAARSAMPLGAGRLAARDRFRELLRAEGRTTLLEVGSGPGRDAIAFAADVDVVAVDRSPGHVRLATAAGVRAIVASMLALPFAAATFDAGWTMSTLVHVPDDRWDAALTSMLATLRPGSPLGVGLWGGVDEEHWQEPRDGLPARFFSRRSHGRARSMLARHATVESFETWPADPSHDDRSLEDSLGSHRATSFARSKTRSAHTGWAYQFAIVRAT